MGEAPIRISDCVHPCGQRWSRARSLARSDTLCCGGNARNLHPYREDLPAENASSTFDRPPTFYHDVSYLDVRGLRWTWRCGLNHILCPFP